AELEDRERPGAYHRLVFHAGSDDLLIDTTRPELLAACVAVVAHPDDDRYAPLVGTTVTTPVFGVEVPFVTHPLAQPDKGTGVAMICTFGDVTDVVWWRELGLPVRAILGRDGRLLAEAPAGLSRAGAALYRDELAGRTVRQAQRRVVELLEASGELVGEPTSIRHPVKFYERGERPLEIVTSRQWFIRTLEHREELLARGRELRWHPPFMGARYASWVEGLNTDWLISRQRFFGVPFPVWYPVRSDGSADHDRPLLAAESRLPVDPTTDVPEGYSPSQRDRPGGFTADPDVMDTWATSSLTPQIAGGWIDDPDLFGRVFPMDLRPQAHEIIRTWLFGTVVRSHLEMGALPWTDAAISGWILDPDRKKMSKSKGNVVVPSELLGRHSSDAVRYWALSARLGTDTAFDEGQMRIGRKLAIKILNASRFVLGSVAPEGGDGAVTEAVDLSLLASLRLVVAEATTAFEDYDYARALERTESWFWTFCDDYVELVKARAYGALGAGPGASARQSLRVALGVLLRLFAPMLPFTTEEVWSWWHEEGASIHRAPWPRSDDLPSGDPAVFAGTADVLREIRRAKTEAGRSMRAPVASVVVRDTAERIGLLQAAGADLREAGTVADLRFEVAGNGAQGGVEVVLAD
ncbi:MAG TPA: valine--tRNA ligase, partial [Acidimicrobiales bacterium]|nr:valine--tRNA ligase [Acidimicrobiales bacterium]